MLDGFPKYNILCFLAGCLFVGLFMFYTYAERPSGPSLMLNVSYHDARKVVLQDGWQPVPNNESDERMGFRVPYFRGLGYIEVDACSGTGMGYCAFHFQKGNDLFLIVTTQELPFGGRESSLENRDGVVVVNYSVTDRIN